MELGELEKVWKNQQNIKRRNLTEEKVRSLLMKKIEHHNEKITDRDHGEILVAALMGIGCAILFLFTDSIWNQLGFATIALGCVIIIYKIAFSKKISSEAELNFDTNLERHLNVELKKAQNQEKLLKSVMWWYLVPLYSGLVFFIIGSAIGLLAKILMIGLATILYAYIWKCNQDAAEEEVRPLIQEIEESLFFLKTDKK